MKRLLIIAALVCGTANASFMSGNELLRDMDATDSFTRGQVLGYVQGVMDFAYGVFICPPSTITGRQAMDIAKQYMLQYPEQRHEEASILIFRSMKHWPCKKNGGSL